MHNIWLSRFGWLDWRLDYETGLWDWTMRLDYETGLGQSLNKRGVWSWKYTMHGSECTRLLVLKHFILLHSCIYLEQWNNVFRWNQILEMRSAIPAVKPAIVVEIGEGTVQHIAAQYGKGYIKITFHRKYVTSNCYYHIELHCNILNLMNVQVECSNLSNLRGHCAFHYYCPNTASLPRHRRWQTPRLSQ